MKPKLGVQRIDSDDNTVGVEDVVLPNDAELSLEELSAAYSRLICDPAENMPHGDGVAIASDEEDTGPEASPSGSESLRAAGDHCIVSGRSIIEAVLFVGNPDNVGLKADSVAGMMRGVQAAEIIEWIRELNQGYLEQGHVMRIIEDATGFRMQLAPEFQAVRDAMTGKLRETQLNQTAIDCLSLVAYRPGISRHEIERLWNRSAGNVLGLLVRRELLRIERNGNGRQAVTTYFPTDRFLNLIGISSLEDLPTAESEFE